jgi:hypothetical protein
VEHKTVDTKEQPVAYLTAHPTNAALLLTLQKYENAEDGKKTRTRIYRTLPGVATTKFVFDEEIADFIEVTNQDLAIGSVKPSDPLIVQCSDAENEQGWITRTTMKVPATLIYGSIGCTGTKTEYKTEMFTFPALLQSVTATQVAVGAGMVTTAEGVTEWQSGINTFVSISPVIRPALSAPTQHKIITQFHSSAPEKDAIYEILPNSLRFSGRLIDLNFGEVLNDDLEISASAATYDMSLQGLSETVAFGASAPSMSAYTAALGAEKIIASDVIRWRGNIWIKRNTSVNLR